ncbi:multidrug effflux MFS transporter [Roseibium aestuarii]|uniref:Bcr/CflA family efflux transporter n=1 Tax=Roseibium aestuarii TaxID=2600299 RepID=A0ABW4JTC7_9HYPH|nr:multidrug effflux MFS transporter [Roseibium aestuarii]
MTHAPRSLDGVKAPVSGGGDPAGQDGARKTPPLLMLIVVSAIAPISMNMYLPSMGHLAEVFGTTSGMVQLTMSLYFVAVALAQIVIGPLSDRYGRRPVLLAGMALYCAGSLACLLVTSIEGLIAARMIQAAGGCSGLVLSRAIVRDLYDRDTTASMLGYVTMGMAIGPMCAPLIGGTLQDLVGWQGSFWLMLVLGLATLAVAALRLHETHFTRSESLKLGQLAGSFVSLLREPLFVAYGVTIMCASSTYFAYLGGMPFLAAGRLAMSPQVMGLYFMTLAFGYIAGNFLSGRYARRIGPSRMVLIGASLPLVGIVAFTGFVAADLYQPLFLFAPMFFVGIGNGLCLPSAISGAVSVRPDLAGAASGLTGSLQMGLGAFSSALVAHLISTDRFADTAWPMVIVMGACVALALAGVAQARRLERTRP